ncbi:hypothetical protein H4R20_000395 [Coemansia guatemalensis]|uniref:Uncharacterized protein n=1 Tax=Coemansia guatemalensis TaxID=2761395 RepID=A0A9W8I176_9FUNG|nr:hypothetical protein H4R20_000395 [Coemansia guatemalensis]
MRKTKEVLDDLFRFLDQHRDLGNLDMAELPASLGSAAELRQLNEGVLSLLPDLNDISGRTQFIDQLVQQLDGAGALGDGLLLGSAPGPTPDPLLSSAPANGLYAGLAAPGLFDLAANPEALAPNPTLADLAPQALSMSPQSVSMPARPIAYPRQTPYTAPITTPSTGSLYAGLYTPLQVQQQALQGMAGNPQLLQRQRMPMPSAQAVDPSVQQARMQALMAYRAMGLQCTAPDDEADADSAPEDDNDATRELSLDEWLDAEKLSSLEVAGTRSLASDVADAPELDDTDANADVTRSAVRHAVAVQRAASLTSAAAQPSANEPVSYLRRRSELVTQGALSEPETAEAAPPAVDRKELTDMALRLLMRINELYLRNVHKETPSENVESPEQSATTDVDGLERELNAMSLNADPRPVSSSDDSGSQRQMLDRLAKLGLPSQSRQVSV